MMWKIQLVSGAMALLAGIALAVIAIVDGRYWGGAGFFTAGIAFATAIVLFEHWLSPTFWFAPVCAALLTTFSVLDAFTSSHLMNLKEADAQRDFLKALINLEAGASPLSAQEKQVAIRAFKVCAIQGELDQLDLVVNSQKALYYGSGLTLADGVNSALDGDQPLRCLDYYRELRKTQPQLFIQIERMHPWLKETTSS
ncbi:hypothetical protein ABE484_10905 [Pseudomonas pudica]|uniref:hypothetical protein n=1 Tax=Pseudomonas pudica TaxID=272772 RepID=UPI00320A3445